MPGLKIITPPVAEPVTLAEMRAQLRLEPDDTDYDDLLGPLITAAREWCEGFQNRSYVERTLELALDNWPCGPYIELPRPPLQSVTSLTYTDNTGAVTIWDAANYATDDYTFVPQLVRSKLVRWPSVSLTAVNGVKVRYIAGYEPVVTGEGAEATTDYGANVPQKIKQAIILLVSHWYENGPCDPPIAVLSLLRQDRVIPV